jgi:hypothetical protein
VDEKWELPRLWSCEEAASAAVRGGDIKERITCNVTLPSKARPEYKSVTYLQNTTRSKLP